MDIEFDIKLLATGFLDGTVIPLNNKLESIKLDELPIKNEQNNNKIALLWWRTMHEHEWKCTYVRANGMLLMMMVVVEIEAKNDIVLFLVLEFATSFHCCCCWFS